MPRPPKRPPEPEIGAPAWMTTFGDLMSLLLTFFVLIVSMSSIQESKFLVAIDSFRRALSWFEGQPPETVVPRNVSAGELERSGSEVPETSDEVIISANKIIRIVREMQTKINELNIGGQVQVYRNDREVRIYIEDVLVFENGSARLRGKEAVHLLENIYDLVRDIPYPLNIEGYTDKMEVTGPGEDYDTRWDLASARALAVLHYLNQKGISSKRLKAVAYGSNRPKYTDNRPEEKYFNNRVEIVIRDTDTE